MVAEEDDRCRVVHGNIFPYTLLVEDRRHWGYILVAKAQISAGKSSIAGLHRGHTGFAVFGDHVAGKYLFCQRYRPLAGGNWAPIILLLIMCHREKKHASL